MTEQQVPIFRADDSKEPILQERQNRFILTPNTEPDWEDIWNLYAKHQEAFWRAEEIRLGDDIRDWKSLTDSERHLLSTVLAFFAASDGIVNDNLLERFMNEVKVPAMKAFYGFQYAMENIHARTYSMLIETYINDVEEQDRLLNAITEIESVKLKAEWTLKWIDCKEASFAQRLIAFCFVEGLFFSASFCTIFWFRKRGLLPGLAQSNELISRDEGLHTEGAILLYKRIVQRVPQEIVHAMAKDAIRCEESFVRDCFKMDKMLGLNAETMIEYTHYVADYLLTRLGYDKIYHASNPFPWMHLISVESKTNFFERVSGEYKKSNVSESVNTIDIIDIDDL